MSAFGVIETKKMKISEWENWFNRSRTNQNSGASRDFGVGPEFGVTRKQSKVGMTFQNNMLEVLVEGFVSPILHIGDVDKIMT